MRQSYTIQQQPQQIFFPNNTLGLRQGSMPMIASNNVGGSKVVQHTNRISYVESPPIQTNYSYQSSWNGTKPMARGVGGEYSYQTVSRQQTLPSQVMPTNSYTLYAPSTENQHQHVQYIQQQAPQNHVHHTTHRVVASVPPIQQQQQHVIQHVVQQPVQHIVQQPVQHVVQQPVQHVVQQPIQHVVQQPVVHHHHVAPMATKVIQSPPPPSVQHVHVLQSPPQPPPPLPQPVQHVHVIQSPPPPPPQPVQHVHLVQSPPPPPPPPVQKIHHVVQQQVIPAQEIYHVQTPTPASASSVAYVTTSRVSRGATTQHHHVSSHCNDCNQHRQLDITNGGGGAMMMSNGFDSMHNDGSAFVTGGQAHSHFIERKGGERRISKSYQARQTYSTHGGSTTGPAQLQPPEAYQYQQPPQPPHQAPILQNPNNWPNQSKPDTIPEEFGHARSWNNNNNNNRNYILSPRTVPQN